jgi:hypothetical protein
VRTSRLAQSLARSKEIHQGLEDTTSPLWDALGAETAASRSRMQGTGAYTVVSIIASIIGGRSA